MVLRFSCPNGHPLSCPDHRAGKPGKCPKCQAKFLVPAEGQQATGGIDESGEFTALAGGSSKKQAAEDATDLIVFLCPNGHKLNGPARLQGTRGQCPHCGARFRIPHPDDVDEDDQEDEAHAGQMPLGQLVDDDTINPHDLQGIEQFSDSDLADEEDLAREFADDGYDDEYADQYDDDDDQDAHAAEVEHELLDPNATSATQLGNPELIDEAQLEIVADETEEPTAGVSAPPPPPGSSPAAQLFAQFWSRRKEGQVVEVLLSNGDMLAPDLFAPKLSQKTHAVFAVKEDDGNSTVTVAPWEEIKRIVVRRVDELPEGFVE